MTRRKGGDETWFRLLHWTKGQKHAERLATQLLRHEGYEAVDPSHPLGGRDGIKDATCTRAGKRWIAAVYFARGQQTFRTIKTKFLQDSEGIASNNAEGIVFITNQELRLGERATLKQVVEGAEVDLFHLERVAQLLNSPACYGLRLEFLDIEMSKEEQVAFFSWLQSQSSRELRENIQTISDLTTGGNSFCYIAFSPSSSDQSAGNLVLVHQGEYPLYNLSVRIVDLDRFESIMKNSPTLEKVLAAEHNFNIPELAPGQALLTRMLWDFENKAPKRYNIFFSARNGTFVQLFRCVYDGDRWIRATQVKRDEEVLFENIDEDYPRNDSGEVEW